MDQFLNDAGNFFVNMYDYVSKRLSIEVLTYIGIAVVVLILALVLLKLVKRRKVSRRLNDLEIEVNDIRNNSLQYKYTKASAFGKVNPDITERMKNLAPKYEICLKSIKSCEKLYEQADDFLIRRKYSKAMKTMDELEAMLDDTQERIRIVNQSLDHILAKETEVRERSNALKERFRTVKNIYQNDRGSFYSAAEYLDQRIEDIENQFNTFEEWMFASEFAKAKEEVDIIAAKTDDLAESIGAYPDLYNKARLLLPKALNEVVLQKQSMEKEHIDISYLSVDEKMDAVNNALSDALVKLDNGNIKGAKIALEGISDQILAMQDDLTREKKAFDEIHGDLEANFAIVDEIDKELDEIVTLYANIKDRFGLEDWTKRFEAAREQMTILKNQRAQIKAQLAKEDILQVDVVHDYRNFAERTVSFGNQVKEMKRLLVGASTDENRAKKQVIKLQLILNEVRLNTISRQLPSVSEQFTEDLKEGEQMIQQVRRILEHSPLDVESLNDRLQDTIDFVYKLYNNASNLTGVAVMVENAIVFGNRYRSTYPELDSELTKAEVCYQNGEYTRALKIAIQAIEALHPGIYEKLIAKKDPAVMNLA